MRRHVELLHVKPETERAEGALTALASAAARGGSRVSVSTRYAGGAEWLVLWGPGAPDRQAAIARQVAAGGRAIALDLAYWSRESKARISIDGPHPQDWVMRHAWPVARWQADPAPLDDAWDPNGPVIVAGIGPKARVQYGAAATLAWEAEQMTAAAALGRCVLYRKKKHDDPVPAGATLAPCVPIDRLLKGASLAVTWHSNVAVDAIRLGIPVVCRDGAAAAVSPARIGAEHRPLRPDVRDRFLANLAWFQWRPQEAAECWRWLEETLA